MMTKPCPMGQGSQSVEKASQNCRLQAATKRNHFLPRHVRGKKYFSRSEVSKLPTAGGQ